MVVSILVATAMEADAAVSEAAVVEGEVCMIFMAYEKLKTRMKAGHTGITHCFL